jgi:hypothetical protein
MAVVLPIEADSFLGVDERKVMLSSSSSSRRFLEEKKIEETPGGVGFV